ncbi:hypothetical protein IH601_02600, partial [Candidatus Bipolaricaulota bacterium]|nr:hypothetical protein [Candidatus Bipolaricaulota bacterium]
MDSQRNLVLTGFMGAGKSTIGALVAQRLGRPFIDMDAEIEVRLGKSIPDIFAEDGEAAFRDHERALCLELADRDGLVIATGGGALVDLSSRGAMAQNGTIVCLTCGIDELVRRIERGPHYRPLLDPVDPHSTIEALLKKRTEAYAALPWHVDTTGRLPNEIVADVLDLLFAKQLEVRGSKSTYPIHIGAGLLQHLGDAVCASGLPAGSKTVVVSNDVVFP